MAVTPYKDVESGKKEQVAQMFNNIAHRYDFLNHFLSLGIDKLWRKKAINYLKSEKPQLILDIATGTGDLAITAEKMLKPEKIIGIDISEGMLAFGREKLLKMGLENKIELKSGDSENIPFSDTFFDAATVAFGVRNFENLEKGLQEIYRVLKPNASFVVLEFSKPRKFPVKQLYNFYFNSILPGIGKMVSKDARAYSYLPESVKAFPDGDDFIDYMQKAGFKNCKSETLMFGIASIYFGKK
jgi:demethylmenaquinone methyltransferase / 2-methoxy-6-polyprenyl-1,4-benzoquinol methylase